MNRKYFFILVILAIFCALLSVIYMWKNAHRPPNIPEMIIPQPASPYKSYINGVGIVEASSKNIFIGIPVNRIVESIKVRVGEKVKKGQILFCLEARDLKAALLTRSFAYENALAKLQKLEALPRTEDITYAEAVLKSSEMEVEQAKHLYQTVEGLQKNGALSKEEINRRRFNYEQAEAKVQQSRANFDKVKGGTWQPDLDIARLEVQQAHAFVKQIEADIQRTIIRAPIDGTILQIKINEGEFPPSDSFRTPPMILGNTDPLHLRVSINQFDASFFSSSAPAMAFLQGNAKQQFPLKFVYVEPYFVTKQNLTNDITEKVDTRVLQVVYCFTEKDQHIFVGQQMDVFIETDFLP